MAANISIIGNLGKAPETKISDNGTLMASFSIASNTFRNTSEGKEQKTDWFRVIAFGKQAETLARYVKKGTGLAVQGRLSFNPWLDRNGDPQAGADIILQEFQFLPGGRRDDAGDIGAVSEYVPEGVQEIAQQAAAY
ncbi:single-stranded DNA-binding protein [Leptolyngbya sp. 7M]|uniref:single-stranded DNA-binding protein n=1 Tax=Leptolyngbya sp. 7M TaxID=2812896 RepID=UPI001B8BA133|nr:single-stranded DNA-binding protein [Leptolyngbya sp. 7M]QYO68053.1 single-stranded DNA-binding protein [Leptolyngbya sp. 7M]